MILAAALAGAAVVMASPAPAPATLQGDMDAAAAYWQQSTPARCTSETVSYVQATGRILGEATIPDPTLSGPCEMDIDRGLTRRIRCLTVVHEYGHWLGLHHSKDKASPMYPIIDSGAVVPECEQA